MMSKLIISTDRQHLSKRSRKLSKRKRHSQKTIHVTIRPSSNITTINNRSISTKKCSSITYQSKNPSGTDSPITKSICLQNLSTQENLWPSTVQDHHRMKKAKKKYQRRHSLLSLCLTLIGIIFATVITLIILFTKPGSKATMLQTPKFCLKYSFVFSIDLVQHPSNAFLRWNSSSITIAGQAGVHGTNFCLLYCPYGLAFDSSKTLYVADVYNNRVQKLLEATNTCVTVAGQINGSPGNNSNQFSGPADVLFDTNDNMYISDRGNARVKFWAKGATSGVTVAGGSSNISLSDPTGIVSNSDSSILYIADTASNRVVSYPTGQVVAGGNGPGNGFNQLSIPYGLSYDSFTNSFIIPNSGTNNIVRWVLGAKNRTYIAGGVNGTSGNNSTLLNYPCALILDPMGNIYVADYSNHRIQLFLFGQSHATTIAGTTGVSGINSNQLNGSHWLILDNQLNLYVSDKFNNRVQKFLRY